MSGFHISIHPSAPSKFPRRSNLSSSDEAEIQRLSSSPSFLRLADSILMSLDRDTLAELIAGYLYFKSKGRTNGDFALFVVTKKFGEGVTIAMNVIVALIPGLLFDKAFRSVIFAAVLRSVGKGRGPPKSARSKDD
jgi:hypothetical protein